MPIERTPSGTSLIDAWVGGSLVGIDLLTVEARMVVAGVDTYIYIKFSDAVAMLGAVPRPTEAPASPSRVDGRRSPARSRSKAGVAARLGRASNRGAGVSAES